ncbi:MAG: ribosome biogenesis GTPase Der [Gammaproteobacteria bacterium]|nr:ribosome biogenesis GTPase Der [Gammaproteobacteria bacterium]
MIQLPVVTIAGRPNVGKSTLFNALTRTRDAIVADQPGVTRDRQYGICRTRSEQSYLLVDTGGIVAQAQGIDAQTLDQVEMALEEAHLILFLVDARAGLLAADQDILSNLRKQDKPILLVANKTDGINWDIEQPDWYQLGLGQPLAIAAAHRRGLDDLQQHIEEALEPFFTAPDSTTEHDPALIRLALIGRPNAGKSTLTNRLLGEERVISSAEPGTTRDSIEVSLERDGKHYHVIDTAGVRRRSRIQNDVEKLSVIKALQSVRRADMALLMIDAQEGMVDQDAHLIGQVIELGKPMLLLLNKWDGMSLDQRQRVMQELDRKLPFADFVPRLTLSALHGSGIGELFKLINHIHAIAATSFSSNKVTSVIKTAVTRHPPPLKGGRKASLSYAHIGGRSPLRIVVHGNRTDTLPASYHRYLLNQVRDEFRLQGIPLQLELRDGRNPFAGRRNTLTKRQLEKRKRLQRHVKGKR